MLGVVRDARREAVAPLRVDLEGVGDVPAPSRPAPRRCRSPRAPRARAASASGSSSRSSEPVTDCQKPARLARSSSSTSSAAVWITTSTDTGSFGAHCRLRWNSSGSASACPGRRTRRRTAARAPPRTAAAEGEHVEQHAQVVRRQLAMPSNSSTWPARRRQDRSRQAILQRVPVAAEPLREARAPARCARAAPPCPRAGEVDARDERGALPRAASSDLVGARRRGRRRNASHRSAVAASLPMHYSRMRRKRAVVVVRVVELAAAAGDDAPRAAVARARRAHRVLAIVAALARAAAASRGCRRSRRPAGRGTGRPS